MDLLPLYLFKKSLFGSNFCIRIIIQISIARIRIRNRKFLGYSGLNLPGRFHTGDRTSYLGILILTLLLILRVLTRCSLLPFQISFLKNAIP